MNPTQSQRPRRKTSSSNEITTFVLSSKLSNSSPSLIFNTSDFDWISYSEYSFRIISLLPSTNDVALQALISIDGGSSYKNDSNYAVRQQCFDSGHADGSANFNGTATSWDFVPNAVGNRISATDTGASGYNGLVRIYNPSITGYKSLETSGTYYQANSSSWVSYCISIGMYRGSTNPINGIKFQFTSGNILSGKIVAYGIV